LVLESAWPGDREWEKEILWMLDLFERRQGTAPTNLSFNDFDFHLHELCRQSPELVRRMMNGGFDELAVMTATEDLRIVQGCTTSFACCSCHRSRAKLRGLSQRK
jgi:hypothetical protein